MYVGTLIDGGNGDVDFPRLAKILDELGPIGRVETIRHWDTRTQAKLFEAAKGVRPVDLDYFVPPSMAPLTEVIHHGHNSLPVFSNFQKRFCKPDASGSSGPDQAPGELWGWNCNVVAPQQWRPNDIVFPLSPFIGPGYFVAHAGEEGEVDINYTKDAGGKVEGWPAVAPSTTRIGYFVFKNLVDVMRGISTHVSIGRGRRGKDWLDAWFVLCREDPKS